MASVLMYCTAACPFCQSAEQLLLKKGARIDKVRIDLEPARRAEMTQKSGGPRPRPPGSGPRPPAGHPLPTGPFPLPARNNFGAHHPRRLSAAAAHADLVRAAVPATDAAAG